MNSIRIPNPSDENSILITAEFFEDGHRLRMDRTRIHRYELDLIVPDDITLDELLVAIDEGIRTQLEQRYHLNDPQTEPAYLDTIRRFEQLKNHCVTVSRDFASGHTLREYLQFRNHAAIDAIDKYNVEQAPADPVPEQEDLWRWLVCLSVFQHCHKQYQQGYPDPDRSPLQIVFRRKARRKHPVIACSSIFSGSQGIAAPDSRPRHTKSWVWQSLHGHKTLRELGFVSSSRLIFDPNSHHLTPSLVEVPRLNLPDGTQFPLYHISKRQNIQPITPTIHIEAPDDLLQGSIPTVFFACGALLVSTAVFLPGALLVQYLADLIGSQSYVLLYFWVLLALTAGWCTYRKLCTARQHQWYRHYEDYIQGILRRLQTIRQESLKLLSEQYPPVYSPEDSNTLLEQTFRLDGSISGRRPDHRDFLHVRIGLSPEGSCTARSLANFQIPERSQKFSSLRYKNIRGISALPFQIIGPGEFKKSMNSSDGTVGFLNCLAEDIQNTYAWLDHAPVLMDLHHPRAVGVYFQDTSVSFYPLLNNVIFDLCYHHSPEDLQLVLFCPEIQGVRNRQEFIRQFKQLPHFNGLLQDQSQFVFDAPYARQVMDQLNHIHGSDQASAPGPHCIVIVLEDHGLRRHSLSALLPSNVEEMTPCDNRITFLFFCHTQTAMPPYCSHVLKLDSSGNYYYIPYVQRFDPGSLQSAANVHAQYGLCPDPYASCFLTPGRAGEQDRMYQGFKILSALRQKGTQQNSLPRRLSLPDLLIYSHTNVNAPPGNDFIQSLWELSQQRWDLRFPIGINDHGPTWVELDQLHHILIAADRDHSQTNSLSAILKSLCCHYSPKTVRLFLADPSPDGLHTHLDKPPHTILNLENGTLEDFQTSVEALLRKLQTVMQKRAAAFEHLELSDIRSYNHALLCRDSHRIWQQLKGRKPLPRLIVAINHLEKFANQAILQELGQLLEYGADYGIHILLSAEQPHKSLTPELGSHFHGKLCMKTQDPSLSEWMLGSDAACATSMPGGSRCFLHDTQTSKISYTQLVQFSGTSDFQIALMEPNGYTLPFYNSDGPVSNATRGWVPSPTPPKVSSKGPYYTKRTAYDLQSHPEARYTDTGASQAGASISKRRTHKRHRHPRIEFPDDQIPVTRRSPVEIPDDQIPATRRSPVEIPDDDISSASF